MNAKAFSDWCARHEEWLATAAVWFVGLCLMGATIWWSERPASLASDSPSLSVSTCEPSTSTSPSSPVADKGMPEPGAVLLPEDTIIGRRVSAARVQSRAGVAQMQKTST